MHKRSIYTTIDIDFQIAECTHEPKTLRFLFITLHKQVMNILNMETVDYVLMCVTLPGDLGLP